MIYKEYADIREGSSGRGSGCVVVDHDIFGYFGGYFLGNFREKASIVCNLRSKTNKKAVLWQGNSPMPL